jgi:chemotaxis protein methyltransferase CheR
VLVKPPETPIDLEEVELELLLEGMHRVYAHDLRGWARPSLRRRLVAFAGAEGLASLSGVQERVLRDPACFARLIEGISVQTTTMFRDPAFYVAVRERVVPLLQTYPFARIWHVGCSTGEEVWSMALLLEEAGLRRRCRVYATDLSEGALSKARAGIYPLEAMKDFTANYQAAGGTRSFSEYYTADDQKAVFHRELGAGIVFARHDLTREGPFNEFQLILCRNVFIYFDGPLQERAMGVIDDSLTRLGLLAFGARESLPTAWRDGSYDRWCADGPIFKKVR